MGLIGQSRVVHNHGELDEQVWGMFVFENENGNVFQTPEMYKLYLAAERCEPILTAIVQETGQIMALMLGARIEEPGIVTKRFSCRVVVMGAPLISNNGDQEYLLGRILRAHNEIVRKRAIFTEIRPLGSMKRISPQFELVGYKYVNHLNATIDLTLGVEHIWSSIRAKKRQAIKKAIKSGLTTEVLTISDLDELYTLIEQTYRKARIPTPSKSLFRSAFTILQSRNLARVVGVKYENRLIAAVLNLLYKDTVYAWFSTVDRQYSHFHGGELAFWWAKQFLIARR